MTQPFIEKLRALCIEHNPSDDEMENDPTFAIDSKDFALWQAACDAVENYLGRPFFPGYDEDKEV